MQLTQRHQLLVVISFLLMCHLATCGPRYQDLWDWRERHRRRTDRQPRRIVIRGKKDLPLQILDDNQIEEPKRNVTSLFITRDEEESENSDTPVLNVTDEDSPYALINQFFPQRESEYRRMQYEFEKSAFNDPLLADDVAPLKPRDVWLSDGDLLVLKGGSTNDRSGFDDPWEPLDDYEAPFREPKLPPPDFIPDDTGVGVPLPPEDDENEHVAKPELDPTLSDLDSNSIEHDETPVMDSAKTTVKKFSEDDFIRQMENFHSIRFSEVVSRSPNFTSFFPERFNLSTTKAPSRLPGSPTPRSVSFQYQFTNKPISSPLISRQPIQRLTPTTTTAATTTTTTRPQYSTSTSVNDVSEVKELKSRQPKSFARYVYNPVQQKAPVLFLNRQRSQLSVEMNEIDDRIEPVTTRLIRDRSHFRKRPDFLSPAQPTAINLVAPAIIASANRFPTTRHMTTRPSDTRLRRNSSGRYVTFFQGNVGGHSWGYSYKL